jgi:hypothetical protein
MRRLSYAVSALAAATIRRSALVGGLVLLSVLALGSPSVSALPVASGSKCSSNWVNNARDGLLHPR